MIHDDTATSAYRRGLPCNCRRSRIWRRPRSICTSTCRVQDAVAHIYMRHAGGACMKKYGTGNWKEIDKAWIVRFECVVCELNWRPSSSSFVPVINYQIGSPDCFVSFWLLPKQCNRDRMRSLIHTWYTIHAWYMYVQASASVYNSLYTSVLHRLCIMGLNSLNRRGKVMGPDRFVHSTFEGGMKCCPRLYALTAFIVMVLLRSLHSFWAGV